MLTSSHKPAGTLDVEGGDDGVDKGWGLVLSASIKRIHVGNDAPELGILNVFCYKSICCHQKLIGMNLKVIGRRTEMKQVDGVANGKYGIYIALQIFPFFREISR